MTREIIVVSGLPRSGTSMMMNMLQAGGIELCVDGIRQADEDNPGGYFELEKVKRLRQDSAWLAGAGGKAVKVISQLLYDLPGEHRYRVLFMRRDLDEVLASQRKMMERSGRAVSDDLRSLFIRHLNEVADWLAAKPNFSVCWMHHSKLMSDPRPWLARIDQFLGGGLDVGKMEAVIDPLLHRNRR